VIGRDRAAGARGEAPVIQDRRADIGCRKEVGAMIETGGRIVRGWLLAAGVGAAAVLSPMASAQVLEPVDDGPPAPMMEAKPRIEFERTEHQFGRVTDEKKIETTFTFRNDGSAPLEIRGIRAGCGCTIPKLEKKIYEPGESGVITVQFDPSKKRGLTNQRITVTSNDPERGSRVLQIKAEVLKLVEFSPPNVAIQRVFRGKGAELRMSFTARKPGCEITELDITGDKVQGIEVRMGGTRPTMIEGEPGTEGEIYVTVSPEAEAGVRQGKLVVRTNDTRKPLLTLPVTGEVRGDIQANPQRVSLGGMVGGERYNRSITLKSRSGAVFGIEDVTFAGPNAPELTWSVEPDQRDPKGMILVVDVIAPERRGIVRGDLVITTNLESEKTVRVPMSGAVRR